MSAAKVKKPTGSLNSLVTNAQLKNNLDLDFFNDELREKLVEIVRTKDLKDVISRIEAEITNSLQMVAFSYQFPCFVTDGAYAIHRSVQDILGYMTQENGPSDKPPVSIDVKFADGSRIKVPWGKLGLPGMGKDAYILMDYNHEDRILDVNGTCEKRFLKIMDRLMNKVGDVLETDSIYKGKAFKLGSDFQPQFLDLSETESRPMYISTAVEFSLQPIISRIENSEICLQKGLDLKFGALLTGAYGSGKTLLAFKLALMAIENNWTFIYLTDPERVADLYDVAGQLSRNGNGVLLFVEDIDLIARGDRDMDMNQILNLLDGGDTKSMNIISIFTTNHLELIDPTFLRGKRIGSIISLTHLDEKTANLFIQGYLEGAVEDDCSVAAKRVEELEIVPSFMAEILDRVKVNSIYTGKESASCQDILDSIDSYRTQMELARTNKKVLNDDSEFVRLLKKAVDKDSSDSLLSIRKDIVQIKKLVS
jgi:transitional endoplasmic reticulum ATPase